MESKMKLVDCVFQKNHVLHWGHDNIRWNQLHGERFYSTWDMVWGIPSLPSPAGCPPVVREG